MRNSLMGLLVVLLLLVSACAKQPGAFHFSGPVDPPLSLTREAVIRVRLTEYDIAKYPSVDQAMWAEGERVGMRTVFNDFLQLEPVFRPSEAAGGCSGFGGGDHGGSVTFVPDPVTHDYVHRFRVSARLAPHRECGGQILALEDDRFLIGTGDRFTAVIYGRPPVEGEGYFLVAQEVEETGNGMLQVVGSGRIIRSLGPAGHGFTSEHAPGGTLCQGELWETNREVEQGDRIFLLNTSLTALSEAGSAVRVESESPGSFPEVVVEPVMEPAFTEPAESK